MSVCPSMHWSRQPPPAQYMLGYTPPGQTPPGRHPLGRHPRRPLQRTVRILLECILVGNNSSNGSCVFLLMSPFGEFFYNNVWWKCHPKTMRIGYRSFQLRFMSALTCRTHQGLWLIFKTSCTATWPSWQLDKKRWSTRFKSFCHHSTLCLVYYPSLTGNFLPIHL